MHRYRLVVFVLSLTLVYVLPSAVQADEPPPDNWHAHPPIHVQGQLLAAPTGYTPDQIRHAYGIDLVPADGTGQVIGLIDAYDAPTAAHDLQTFITSFNLRHMNGLPGTPPCTVAAGPHPCFQTVAAQSPPQPSGAWLLETTLDVQWAHAIAPGADILLIESKDDSLPHLLGAVDTAVRMGAQIVSMSWGGPEFAHEIYDDHHFNQPSVTFIAASGDSGTGVNYPAASPYVLAVGGTTLPLDSTGTLTGDETAWSGSGGGISSYETEPGYQVNAAIPATGGKRGVPDIAYDADPSTGVAVYGSTLNQGQPAWFQVGGTSVGTPQWAGLIALADQLRNRGALASNDLVNAPVYQAATAASYTSTYRDVTAGNNGSCGSVCIAAPGYDFVTGLGSPRVAALIPYLATH